MVASVCAVAALLLGAPTAEAQPSFDQNGVLFVHGFVGTGGQFESQKLRFMSNGYPERWIDTIDYDSTFATESRAQVHERIDALVAGLKQRTGRPKVDLLGHSLGTSVLQEYLTSSPERAANVAHYVNIDGSQADALPGGVPTLAVWAGRGTPGRRILGALNVTLPNQTHVESATSAEAFAEYYKFFTGRAPAHDIVPQAGQITIAGRVLVFPLNKGAAGSNLAVWEVDGGTGRRRGSAPVASVALGESGDWGPVEVVAGRHYEFEVTRPGAPVHHHYYEPFVRSDHLVRLLESDVLANGAERGPGHSSAVILRYKELWGDQPGQNDVLSINGTNVCTEVLCPVSKRVNAYFFSDRKLDGQSDLSQPDPVYNALPFVTGVDFFAPAAIPPAGKTTIAIKSRGGGPTRAVNMPNFPSITDVASVQLNDFEHTDTGAPCLRPASVAFRLHRVKGTRVVRVEAFVNGRRRLVSRGRDVRRIELRKLARSGRLKVRIVATHNTGSKVVSTRTWNGCEKGKPRVRVVRR